MIDNKELKAANHRLNERVRELDYALMQCEEDKALAETQCDEARQWARALLARAENLGWLVERIGASWREGKAQLEEALAEAKSVEPTGTTRPMPYDINWEKLEGGGFYRDFDGEVNDEQEQIHNLHDECRRLEEQIAELKQPEPDVDETFYQAIERLRAAKRPIATLAPVDTE